MLAVCVSATEKKEQKLRFIDLYRYTPIYSQMNSFKDVCGYTQIYGQMKSTAR